MGVWAVALLVVAVAAVVASSGVVVVVFHLEVNIAVVIIAGCPVEGGMVVDAGLSCSGQWWGRRSAGHAPVVVRLSHSGELGNGVVVGEGLALGGIDGGGGRHANWSGRPSRGISRGIGGRRLVSFQSFRLDTSYDRGRGSQTT